MRIDLETDIIPDASPADVCIVGAGIAGLTLANALRRKGLRVDILDAGGTQIEESCQKFFQVDCPERRHTGVVDGRFRVFGGSSTQWGGQLLPFGEEVFTPRPGRMEAEWPVRPDEIYRYSGDVRRIMGVNDFPFESHFTEHVGAPKHTLRIENVRVRYSMWAPFSRRNLAQTLGKSLEADSGARIILHANVVSLELDRAGEHIESLQCRTCNGRELRIKVRMFVLAAGTIETVRLLLCSQQGAHMGIGNCYGQLGKYFHDHLSVVIGGIQLDSIRHWERYFAPWWIDGVLHTARLEAHPHLVADRKWMDAMACFAFVTEDTKFEQFRQFLKARQRGQTSLRQLLTSVSNLQSDWDMLRLALAATLQKRRLVPRGGRIEMHVAVEQVPASSIRLSSEHDSLGMPRAVLDWRVSPEELRTVHEFHGVLRKAWNPTWGKATWHDFTEPEAYLPHTRDTFHMMGGARMGTSERNSVVDSNLKVHAVDNLYVASCATYPTGGSSNPTFTLMCLCLRLAEELARVAQNACRREVVWQQV